MQQFRLALLLSFIAISADPLQAQEGALKDVNGDPLPAGAIARLGSARWRVGGPAENFRFLDGGKKLFVGANAFNVNGGPDITFHLFENPSGKEFSRLVAVTPADVTKGFGLSPSIAQWALSPDGELLANVPAAASDRRTQPDIAGAGHR